MWKNARPISAGFPGIHETLAAGARPKTLAAAVVPVLVGTVLGAVDAGAWRWDLAWIALTGCLCLQVATNFFNDVIDYKKGADTEARLGPARLTAAGKIRARTMIVAACVVLALAALCGVLLYLDRGWPVIAIGIPSLYFCFGYTGGPWPLAYRGLGELFVVLFFGLVAVGGSYFLQTQTYSWDTLLAGLQIGFLSASLIAINNYRDIDEDKTSGKRTMAVRFGPEFARWEILVFLLAPYDLTVIWAFVGRPIAALLPFVIVVFGGVLALSVFRSSPGPRCNRFLGLSALHMLCFAILLGLGFQLSS